MSETTMNLIRELATEQGIDMDEQAFELVQRLTEELGEKELKIMALEKELEAQKKEKLEYYDLCQIRQYKLDYLEDEGEDYWSVEWVITNNQLDDDLMIKTILHYFGGSIMTEGEIIRQYWTGAYDINWDDYLSENTEQIVDLDNDTGNYWVSGCL
jgi:hypothetical protein